MAQLEDIVYAPESPEISANNFVSTQSQQSEIISQSEGSENEAPDDYEQLLALDNSVEPKKKMTQPLVIEFYGHEIARQEFYVPRKDEKIFSEWKGAFESTLLQMEKHFENLENLLVNETRASRFGQTVADTRHPISNPFSLDDIIDPRKEMKRIFNAVAYKTKKVLSELEFHWPATLSQFMKSKYANSVTTKLAIKMLLVEEEEKICQICFSNQKNCILLGNEETGCRCGVSRFCIPCVLKIIWMAMPKTATCPICRGQISCENIQPIQVCLLNNEKKEQDSYKRKNIQKNQNDEEKNEQVQPTRKSRRLSHIKKI